MKQSRLASLIETIGSTLFGFVVTLAAQPIVYPWFGFHPTLIDNLGLVSIFTVLSIVRGYVWRRLGEALHIRRPISPAMLALMAERYHQIEIEGYTPAHDDDLRRRGELANAAAAYAVAAFKPNASPPATWPWDLLWWKQEGPRRDLVRAGALILAEIERLDRNRTPESNAAGSGGAPCLRVPAVAADRRDGDGGDAGRARSTLANMGNLT